MLPLYMVHMVTKNSEKVVNKYYCEKCDYTCRRKYDYDKHILTRKHNRVLNGNKKVVKVVKVVNKETSKLYHCICGKEYMHSPGLSRHKKICELSENDEYKECKVDSESIDSTMDYKQMFLELMKKNSEMTSIMIEQHKTIQEIIPSISNNINSNNTNNFNINVFLNEQCKDAMNIKEFIESIQLNVKDMERIGCEGQTNGMANILIDKLNTMDVLKRPVHCSDVKKEIIYVKDDDKWGREERNNPKIKSALDTLTKKSIQALPCMENNPDEYVKTISEVLKDPREDNKIISQLVKKIVV